MDVFNNKHERLKHGNDYAIVALADSERANLAVMKNKQMMKMVIIYIGFAVMSFAMMFIILGFTDKPLSATGDGLGVKLDLKFGSIGAAVFVIGAAMSAGGGLLPNEYKVVGLPGFKAGLERAGGQADDPMANCLLIDDPQMQKACLTPAPLSSPSGK